METTVTPAEQVAQTTPAQIQSDETTAAPAAPAPAPGPDIDTLLAQAEERGYLRGKNEVLSQWMQHPSMLQNLARTNSEPATRDAPSASAAFVDSFLSDIRPGIWE